MEMIGVFPQLLEEGPHVPGLYTLVFRHDALMHSGVEEASTLAPLIPVPLEAEIPGSGSHAGLRHRTAPRVLVRVTHRWLTIII